jgi:PAT family beta-lactamase induction signal transducer AmpG
MVIENKNQSKWLDILLNKDIVVMFFMGLCCGFPFALTASTLKAWLSEYNISMREVSAFAFVAIPYSLKFLWSPIIDAVKLPLLYKKMGQRRSWLLVIQVVLILTIFLLSQSKPQESLLYCAVIATMVSFFSASQDIVVDAYRIERLKPNDQSMGITFYIYGYRIGLYISGAVLLVVADYIDWKYAYYIGGIIMMLGILVTLFVADADHHYKDKTKKTYKEYFYQMVVEPFKNFTETKGWYYFIFFVVLFKLGDSLAGNLTIPFLMKIGFTKTEIALIVKTYGLPATLFGTFLGGLVVHRYGLIKSLVFAGIIQMLSNVMFIAQDHFGHDPRVLVATVSIENISGSIGDVVFIGYISTLCNFRFAATQYALLSSIATVGRNVLAGSSGFIADDYGWTVFFIISMIMALPGLLLIFKIKNIKRSQ